MRLLFMVVPLVLISSGTHANLQIETQIRKAFLTLSAFECAVVSPKDEDAERLFMLGLKAGRDFIRFSQANPDVYLKSLKSRVPILWNLTSGPTPDFILGQLYADRVDEVYKDLSTNKELSEITKQNIYHSKNCALLK